MNEDVMYVAELYNILMTHQLVLGARIKFIGLHPIIEHEMSVQWFDTSNVELCKLIPLLYGQDGIYSGRIRATSSVTNMSFPYNMSYHLRLHHVRPIAIELYKKAANDNKTKAQYRAGSVANLALTVYAASLRKYLKDNHYDPRRSGKTN
jgi:hypothetical protein